MSLMEIVKTILALGVIGFVVYLIVTYIPMPAIFQTVISVVVAIGVILWFINQSGLFSGVR